MATAEKRRFSDEDDPDELRLSKFAKKTQYATDYSERLFRQFLERRNLDIMQVDIATLDSELSSFYAQVRKLDGEDMTSTTLTTMRYGLARHLKTVRGLDIIKDSSFTRSNEVFSGKMAKLKRDGKGATNHFDVISTADLSKIAALSTENPTHLQMKVWVTLQFHLAPAVQKVIPKSINKNAVFNNCNITFNFHTHK